MTVYTPNDWVDFVSGTPSPAQVATAEKLNRIEAALVEAYAQLAGTTTGEASKLLMLDDSGRATIADATDDTHAASLGQVKTLIATGGGNIREVVEATLGSQPSVVSSTTPVDVPDLVMTGLHAGTKLKARFKLKYRGALYSGGAGGIQVLFKTNSTGLTNLDPNPSYETDISGVSATGLTTLSQATTGGAQDGAKYLRAVITGTSASQQIWGDWVPVNSIPDWSAGASARRASATPRTVRAGLQFKDAAGNLLTNFGGTDVTPGTGGWTQAIFDDTHGGPVTVPATATHVRRRILIFNVVAGDEFHFDATQLEPYATLPAFGHTAGGTTALDIDGEWYALATAATSRESGYTKVKSIRTADSSDVSVTAGALGTSEDSVLTGEFDITVLAPDSEVALQFAQLGSSTTGTQLESGSATFVVMETAAA